MRDEILSPAKLASVCRREVATCSPADPIGMAARKMHEGGFSQLPVYDDGRLIGLLPVENVSRWLASRLAHGEGIFEEQAVEQVLRHAEEVHEYQLAGQEATMFDALAAFEEPIHAGRVLDAIILTHSGQPTEAPVGMVTVSDVPRLTRLVAL